MIVIKLTYYTEKVTILINCRIKNIVVYIIFCSDSNKK